MFSVCSCRNASAVLARIRKRELVMLFHVHPAPTQSAPAALVYPLLRPVADGQTFDRNRVAVASPDALRMPPGGAYEHILPLQLGLGWGFMRVSQSDDTLGPDGRPFGPPPSPGSEPRLSTDQTGVVAHCDIVGQSLEKRGFKVVGKLVSRSSKYGVVWRADMAAPGDVQVLSRLICWKIPGRSDFSFLDRPLTMFDPSDSIPPLSP
jgi:hypothetical protein